MTTVNINDKDYPVLARYSSIKRFCDKKGIDLFEFHNHFIGYGIDKKDFKASTSFIDDMALLMICFLERGAEANHQDLDLTQDDILDWFMDGNSGVVYELMTEATGKLKNREAPQTKEGQG